MSREIGDLAKSWHQVLIIGNRHHCWPQQPQHQHHHHHRHHHQHRHHHRPDLIITAHQIVQAKPRTKRADGPGGNGDTNDVLKLWHSTLDIIVIWPNASYIIYVVASREFQRPKRSRLDVHVPQENLASTPTIWWPQCWWASMLWQTCEFLNRN